MKIRIKLVMFILFIVDLLLISFLVGAYYQQKLTKLYLHNDDNYSGKRYYVKNNLTNIPNNLSMHLCSSECIYDINLSDRTKINDSFIQNNLLNVSNCIKCNKLLNGV